MPFRCPTCGAVSATIEQLASHKRLHQQASPRSSEPGVTCIGCGKSIPLSPSQTNYRGPLPCPSCGRTMKVVIEGGQVVTALLTG